jgi:tRNA(His) guanylyltransferase
MEDNIETIKKDLGVRMKEYESTSLEITKIEPYKSFIVRLDGRSFSKFTNGLKSPFDMNFTNAMIKTTTDLINEFTAVTGYTHSDEITIIFKSTSTKEDFDSGLNKATHIFDGRVIKLLTCMSGYCSVRFNYHLYNILKEKANEYKPEYISKINEFKACFDARCVIFPDEKEIVNHMIWRSLFDCERNAVSTYARDYFSQKEINNKGKFEMLEMLKTKGLDWIDVPMVFKHGVYLKKSTYEVIFNNEKAIRTKVIPKCFKIKYNDFYFNILMDKYYTTTEEEEKLNQIENLNN